MMMTKCKRRLQPNREHPLRSVRGGGGTADDSQADQSTAEAEKQSEDGNGELVQL